MFTTLAAAIVLETSVPVLATSTLGTLYPWLMVALTPPPTIFAEFTGFELRDALLPPAPMPPPLPAGPYVAYPEYAAYEAWPWPPIEPD